MTKAVFTHKDTSRYDDLPERRYHFPARYLGIVEQTVGDWIIYYEPRRGGPGAPGRQACFACAQVTRITPDPARGDHHYALLSGYFEFPSPPPFKNPGGYFERRLQRGDGATNKGAFGWSVRPLTEDEFAAILSAGTARLRPDLRLGDWAAPTGAAPPGLAEDPAPFLPQTPRPIIERLTSRPAPRAAFARLVKAAYGNTCALTGLSIVNGGGRPEVQAAHIRPVAQDGPDTIRNGLALSGAAHWMFDRGLVSADDDGRILIAEGRLPDAARALLRPEGRLLLPEAAHLRPHPAYLAHHRGTCFKG